MGKQTRTFALERETNRSGYWGINRHGKPAAEALTPVLSGVEGEGGWEEAVVAGIAARQAVDKGRWELGDLALAVEARYAQSQGSSCAGASLRKNCCASQTKWIALSSAVFAP
jgi:hypothetical protein